jgi:myo-inositol-1(or 4)-monophosphatase
VGSDEIYGVKTEEMERYRHVAEATAREAGEFLLSMMGTAAVREKKPGDWVTSADVASQELIFRRLQEAFPGHRLLGEEEACETKWDEHFCWIVDPIDGTKNFVYGLPSFSVSIALFVHGQPLIGVVYDPLLKECFTAAKSQGAWLNQIPIQPRLTSELNQALLVCSFPSRVTDTEPELLRFNRVIKHATLRRLGSAALNLSYVACGRLDGYWASTLSLWDVAAGILIATEAGACCRNLQGESFQFANPQLCVTGTVALNRNLIPLLQV